MESNQETHANKQGLLIEEDQVKIAKEVIRGFLILFKVFSIYPKENAQSKQSLSNAMEKLQSFFEWSDHLRLEISKYHISLEGEVIFEGPEEEGNFAFIFFRDGIQWLDLQEGITEQDLLKLFRIITSQRTRAAVEDDIVTALWEAEIPHVDYHATDDLFLFGVDNDVSTETIMKDVVEYNNAGTGSEEGDTEKSTDKSVAPGVATDDAPALHIDIEDNGSEIIISEKEGEYLKNLISEEMNRDPNEEALTMLIDALKGDKHEEGFEAIISFFEELYLTSLQQSNFAKAIQLIEKMEEIKVLYQKEQKSALSAVDKFFSVTSGTEALQLIEEKLPEGDPKLVLKLLQLACFNATKEEPLIEILEKTKSKAMRKALIAILIQRKSSHIEPLFGFIEDEDKTIRKVIFEYLGKQKSRNGEELLMEYIQEKEFYKKKNDQILTSFMTLGRCGSSRSIPVLMKILTRKSVFLGPEYDAIRLGAALALKGLGTERALNILERGRESKEKAIRKACMTALVKDTI